VSQVLFFIAAIGALGGAVGVVTMRNPFFSVLALVFHLISLAALFLLLRAEFVAAAQVVVGLVVGGPAAQAVDEGRGGRRPADQFLHGGVAQHRPSRRSVAALQRAAHPLL